MGLTHQALSMQVSYLVCLMGGGVLLDSAFSFHQCEWYFSLHSNETFIFLLKLHINRALWKAVEIPLNMQNCVHRPLYGCPVMYFWDMQIWHFCDCSSIPAPSPFSLSLSLPVIERWDITCSAVQNITADCSICLVQQIPFSSAKVSGFHHRRQGNSTSTNVPTIFRNRLI